MVIPSEYKMTADGEDFLLYDSGSSDQRMLVFSTVRNIKLLENSTDWFGDGTFKVVPGLFYHSHSDFKKGYSLCLCSATKQTTNNL